ncbi:hypothetical protein [Streptomyces bluensis]|uniref:hypothetical protein n=1 Tax=Streptomyces bluensis TaxID=33897 RepID=UPI0033254203
MSAPESAASGHDTNSHCMPHGAKKLTGGTDSLADRLLAHAPGAVRGVACGQTRQQGRDFALDVLVVNQRAQRVVGISYWGPIAIGFADGSDPSGWIVGGDNEVESFFDYGPVHQALPGLSAFRAW